jgi:SAM-dependent methyltransferase
MQKHQPQNLSISQKQEIEISFWRNSLCESPENESISNIINKISDAEVFIDCLNRFKEFHSYSGKVLELGAGQGWASCIYKKMYPQSEVITTDISEFALESVQKWERIWKVKIDKAYRCLSYQTSESDNSVDFIFAFASAHHFLAHNRTLKEISRILKSGCSAIYLFDTGCSKFFYPLMYRLVNKLRVEVPEDVLILSEIKSLAKRNNLSIRIDYYPSLIKRGYIQKKYFQLLNFLPFIRKVLPCSVNIIFTKY